MADRVQGALKQLLLRIKSAMAAPVGFLCRSARDLPNEVRGQIRDYCLMVHPCAAKVKQMGFMYDCVAYNSNSQVLMIRRPENAHWCQKPFGAALAQQRYDIWRVWKEFWILARIYDSRFQDLPDWVLKELEAARAAAAC